MTKETSPLITKEILANLPRIEDAGMLGFEARALLKLHVPKANYALYISGSDGDNEIFGLLNTTTKQWLGLFYLAELEWARQVLGIPIERDESFTFGELREIAYKHYIKFLRYRSSL